MADLIFDGTFHGDEHRETDNTFHDPSGHYSNAPFLCFSDSFTIVNSFGGRTGKIAKMVNHYGIAGRCKPTDSDNHNNIQSVLVFSPNTLPNRTLWVGYSQYMQSPSYPQGDPANPDPYVGLIYSMGARAISSVWTVNRTVPQISQLRTGEWLLLYGNNTVVSDSKIPNPGENKWLDILFHYKYSADTNDGISEYFLKKDDDDYVLIGGKYKVNNWFIQPGQTKASTRNLIRVGTYMDHTTTKNVTIYLSNIKVGTTRADVEPIPECPTPQCSITITQ